MYKNFTLTNTDLFGSSQFHISYKLNSLLTLPFYKIYSFIFSCLD